MTSFRQIALRLVLIFGLVTLLTALQTPRQIAAAPMTAPTDVGPVPAGAIARIGRGEPEMMRISPNEKRIAIETPLGLFMYDAATMRQLWYKAGAKLEGMAFSSDSKWIVGVRETDLVIWNVEGGGVYKTIKPKYGTGNAEFTSDNRYLVATDGFAVSLIEVKSGKELYITADVEAGDDWDRIVASPDGKLIAVASSRDDDFINIFDLATGALLRRFEPDLPRGDRGNMWSLAFSPDSQFITVGTTNGMISTWNAITGEFIRRVQVGDEETIVSMDYSADGTQLVAGSNHLYVYDMVSGHQIGEYDLNAAAWLMPYFSISGGIRAMALAPEGFQLWNADAKAIIVQSTAHVGAIYTGGISPDGKTMLISRVYTTGVEKWNAVGRERVGYYGSNAIDMAYSPDGKLLSMVAASVFNIHTWDVATGQILNVIDTNDIEETFIPWRIAYDTDGSLWVASYFGGVSHWNPVTGERLAIIADFVYYAWDVTLAPAGGKIVFWGDEYGEIYDIPTGEVNAQIELIDEDSDDFYGWFFPSASAMTKDGSRLVATDGYTLRIWDTSNGKELRRIDVEDISTALTLAISPDSRVIALGHEDGTITIWNLKSGARVRVLRGHYAEVSWVGFNPANGQLISMSYDGTVVYWPRQ